MAKVFLVSDQSDRHWVEALRRAARSLGKSLVLVDHQRLEGMSLESCELVILDAGAISEDLVPIMQRIRSADPQIRIVVVSSTPHWKQARSILLAGAADYTRKVDDKGTILDILRGRSPHVTLDRWG